MNTDSIPDDKEIPSAPNSQEYSKLSKDEQERLNDYMESLAKVEQAQKWRSLFNNAPKETLPFIVYCCFVSANALVATVLLITQTSGIVPYYLLIAGAMILPLVALPRRSFVDSFAWVRDSLSR